MSPNKLFIRRLTTDWKYKYGVWKTTVDWTVALYIVIPALILGIDQYLQWWKVPLFWVNQVPINILLVVCYLFAWAGSPRIFLEEGDQLFLLNRTKWLKQIIKQGLIYSFLLNSLFSMFFFVLLAPLLMKHYQISSAYFACLFFITLFLKIFLGLAKQLLNLRYYGWKEFIVVKGLLITGSFVFIRIIPYSLNNYIVAIITMLVLIMFSLILTLIRINFLSHFLADVAREQKQRLKYVSFLLIISGINVKKPKKQRIRPLLFYKSNLIFKKRTPVNGIVEMCIKATLRNNKSVKEYLQLVFVCTLVVFSLPSILKWLIWLVLAFVWVNFVSLYWREIISSETGRIFQWKWKDKIVAFRKFIFLMTIPGFLLISLIVGFQTFSWIGVPLIIPISIIMVFYACRIVTVLVELNSTI